MSDEILLDAGTNELEVMEISVGDQSFGINVLKIRQILKYEGHQITPIPGAPPSVLGSFVFHGKSTPIIDLKAYLGIEAAPKTNASPLINLVCEFNNTITGFLITGISSIHRMSWEAIKTPSEIILASQPITGSTIINNREMPMLDFEAILSNVMGIEPEKEPAPPKTPQEQKKVNSRETVKLLVVDDSRTIRMQIETCLKEAGYQEIQKFENGLSAHMHVKNLNKKATAEGKSISDYLIVVVTDIEMPGMDGLTLCKKIKTEMPEIKVIVLSSLVNDQLAIKCKQVFADNYLSKRDIRDLVGLVDEICL